MALTSRLRSMGKVTGVAASTAPYVRRVATDEDLRADVADFIRAGNDLMRHVAADKQLRRDLSHIVGSAQSSAGHLRSDIRPRHYGRRLFFGTGLITTSMVLGAALAWPRARNSVVRVSNQTAQRANATVHDIRERIATQTSSRKAA
jgi:hypothetical protein